MASARQIKVEIIADTTQLERGITRAALIVERSWWRRTLLRLALWRLGWDIRKKPRA